PRLADGLALVSDDLAYQKAKADAKDMAVDDKMIEASRKELQKELLAYFRGELVSIQALALYGQSEADLTAGQAQAAAERRAPFAKKAKEGKVPELKGNPQLVDALLYLTLRADVQAGRTEPARTVVEAMLEAQTAEKVGAGAEKDKAR